MKGSNILQRTGIIGSNPIVVVLRVREVKHYQEVKRNTENTNRKAVLFDRLSDEALEAL